MRGVEVLIDNRSGRTLKEWGLSSLAAAVLSRLGFEEGELGVAMVSPDEMRLINRKHMGRDCATDVLSFPLDMEEVQGGVPRLLGDVIVCPEVAGEQAGEHGTTEEQELCLLLIHGILHIAGYDHETDAGEMEEQQSRLFDEFC